MSITGLWQKMKCGTCLHTRQDHLTKHIRNIPHQGGCRQLTCRCTKYQEVESIGNQDHTEE